MCVAASGYFCSLICIDPHLSLRFIISHSRYTFDCSCCLGSKESTCRKALRGHDHCHLRTTVRLQLLRNHCPPLPVPSSSFCYHCPCWDKSKKPTWTRTSSRDANYRMHCTSNQDLQSLPFASVPPTVPPSLLAPSKSRDCAAGSCSTSYEWLSSHRADRLSASTGCDSLGFCSR